MRRNFRISCNMMGVVDRPSLRKLVEKTETWQDVYYYRNGELKPICDKRALELLDMEVLGIRGF